MRAILGSRWPGVTKIVENRVPLGCFSAGPREASESSVLSGEALTSIKKIAKTAHKSHNAGFLLAVFQLTMGLACDIGGIGSMDALTTSERYGSRFHPLHLVSSPYGAEKNKGNSKTGFAAIAAE